MYLSCSLALEHHLTDVTLKINPSVALFFAGFGGGVDARLHLHQNRNLPLSYLKYMEAWALHSQQIQLPLKLLWTQLTSERKRFSISYLVICRGVVTTFGKEFRMLKNRVKDIKLVPGSNSSVDNVAIAQFNIEKGKTEI